MSQSDVSDNFDEEGLCPPGAENTGRWTSEEHLLFLKGLEQYGKGWKLIATLIQTRTVVQIRTHAQKYFQKLSKAQASGSSHLDPATLMSTMDAGRARPASVARNLRSSTMANSAAEAEGRLRSLRNRRNRGRNSRLEQDRYDSNTSHSGSSDSSQEDDYDDDDSDDERKQRDKQRRQRQRQRGNTNEQTPRAPGDTGGGDAIRFEEAEKEEEAIKSHGDCMNGNTNDDGTDSNSNSNSVGVFRHGAGKTLAGIRLLNARRGTPKKNCRSSPVKIAKGINSPGAREGGAADARALAWEAAASKAKEFQAGGAGVAGVTAATAGVKRNRAESNTRPAPSHGSDLTISGAIKDLKRVGAPQGTRISPTSVSDINFMSFPVPQMEQPEVASHTLPKQLAPSWCTKPQDDWTVLAGVGTTGVDSDDAGPFRWFIDERSLSAPGAFFHPPAEAWSDSDSTEASTAVGANSGPDVMDNEYHTVVPELPVSTNKVDVSPCNSMAFGYEGNASPDDDAHPAKRRCLESTNADGLRSLVAHAPESDPTIAIAREVTCHVEGDGDGDGLDITSGLWIDHPQESASLMCGLGLTSPACVGPGGTLSLPSLDEDEVMGFLACEEQRLPGVVEM